MLNTVALRVTRKLRQAYMNTIIGQPIPYFDSCAPGAVVTDLAHHASAFEHGLSEASLGMTIQSVATIITAAIIAFTQSWRLTLVMSTCVIALFGSLYGIEKWNAKFEREIGQYTKESAEFAEEVISSIGIVTAYGAVGKLGSKYMEVLMKIKTVMLSNAPWAGLDYAVSYFVLLSAYSLSFWYGVQLLSRGQILSGGRVVMYGILPDQAST